VNILNGIVNLFRFDKTNWKAVALCLLAATVFWFFNALNKEHTATLRFPLQFQYNHAKFIPVQELPQHVLLNLTGSGWDLLRKSLGFKVAPLSIEISRPDQSLRITPSAINQAASSQLGQTKVNHVASDTLILSFEPRKNKKVKLVVGRNQLRFELGFGLSGAIAISPDSVLIEGPSSRVMKIPDSILLPLPLARLSNNFKRELEIPSFGVEQISVTPKSATITFEVSELTDIDKHIKVIVLPSPPFRYQASSDSVVVTIRVPANQGNDIRATQLFAVIDLRAMEPGIMKMIPSIKGLPANAIVVSADSITVRKY
jgi:hypothetical protein